VTEPATKLVERTEPPTGAADDLSRFRIVFVDHGAALNYARARGVGADAEFRTASPTLVHDPSFAALPVDDHLDAGYTPDLSPATLAFTKDLFARLGANPETEPYAIVAAQIGIAFPSIAHKAMALRERDFDEPVLIVGVDAGSAADDRRLNLPWSELLAANPRARTVTLPAGTFTLTERHLPETEGFLDRQRFGGWEKIGFQLVQALWRKLPFASPRGTFLLLRENLLLRETALHLTYRGYGLRSIKAPPDNPLPLPADISRLLDAAAMPALEAFLGPRVVAKALAPLCDIFLRRLRRDVGTYRASLPYWRELLDGLAACRPRAVLTNMMLTPQVAALHRTCRERGLPVVSFQHGVSRELSHNNWHVQAYFEGNTSDIFYAFNPVAAGLSDGAAFNRARAVPVGLPACYWRCGTFRKPDRRAPPILYASTLLYTGNVNMVAVAGASDIQMAATEIDLIDRVWRRLPHRVLYKPYPETRYLDPDPVTERARAASNVTVFEAGDDLNRLIPDCRVVVSARATSTIAWCATSGKPFVFIDHEHEKPLRAETRAAFERAFFLFDSAAPTFHDDLRAFLSRPLDEIERLWAEKAEARARVLDEFFGVGGPGAGRRAAAHLLETLAAGAVA